MKEYPPTSLIQTSSLGLRFSHRDACREVIFVESVEVVCRTACRGRKMTPEVSGCPNPLLMVPSGGEGTCI